MTTVPVDIQRAVELEGIPADEALERFARAALEDVGGDPDVTLRIVDEAEGRALNRRWRGKDSPTNVLSFPAARVPGLPDEAAPAFLGDVVVCAPVVAAEAARQGKAAEHHWAHLVIHGILHLRGFDHTSEPMASEMESEERARLAGLGISDPYAESGRDGTAGEPSNPSRTS